jgi:hypothetical protein
MAFPITRIQTPMKRRGVPGTTTANTAAISTPAKTIRCPKYLTEKRPDCQFPGTELSGQRSLERRSNLTHLPARNNPRALPPSSRHLLQ